MEKQPKKWNPLGTADLMDKKAHADVLGSYTGTPADGGQPVQDADDL